MRVLAEVLVRRTGLGGCARRPVSGLGVTVTSREPIELVGLPSVAEPVVDLELQPGGGQHVEGRGRQELLPGEQSPADQAGDGCRQGRLGLGLVVPGATLRPKGVSTAPMVGWSRSFQRPSAVRYLCSTAEGVPPLAGTPVSKRFVARSRSRMPARAKMPSGTGSLSHPNVRSSHEPAAAASFSSSDGRSRSSWILLGRPRRNVWNAWRPGRSRAMYEKSCNSGARLTLRMRL